MGSSVLRKIINPVGAIFNLPDPLLDAVLPADKANAAGAAQQRGTTNAEAQARSNAQSAAKRARQLATLANQKPLSLANEEDDRLLS